MAFTEFTCRASGDNLNAGTVTGSTAETATGALVTYTGGDYNGSTGVYVAPVGANMTEAVVGRFMSVYADGNTVPTSTTHCVGRITAVVSGTRTITMATRVNFGTAMGTTTGNRSAKIGGAWLGPNGANSWPIGFLTSALTDATVNRPRVNMKNDQTYSITAAMSSGGLAGPMKFQGYTTAYADGGSATIDGGTSGTSYVLLTNSGTVFMSFEDIIFQNNGATGSATLVDHITSGNAYGWFRRCVFAHSRGHGLQLAVGPNAGAIECEAYDCNQSNTANLGGFSITIGGTKVIRCISHDNSAGSNAHGFILGVACTLVNCVADSNAGCGAKLTGGSGVAIVGCDFYNNGLDGILDGTGGGNTGMYIENCNFFKNGGYGINMVSGATAYNFVVNSFFGAGTQQNTTGTQNISAGTDVLENIGSSQLTANEHPWVDPANGNFRIAHSLNKGAGRGTFLQTASSYAGTVGYPDVGAAQHQEIISPTFALGI